MNLLTELKGSIGLPSPVLTVGTFDGLHLGHLAILNAVIREAEGRHGSSVVLTFDRHPRSVLSPGTQPPMLLSPAEKRQVMARAGLGTLIELPFTPEIADTSPEAFVRGVIVDCIGPEVVVMGHDHRFGRDRAGDVSTMRTLGRKFGFEVVEVGPTVVGGEPVSSTRLRRLISEGLVGEAAALLGRPYGLLGDVVKGDGRGRGIGFPTANVRPDAPEKLLPANGVYAVSLKGSHGWSQGVCNIGTRPTFDGEGRTVEAHLLDFEGSLYGQTVEVSFHARLREERRFSDAGSLVAQIRRDVEAARQHLDGKC